MISKVHSGQVVGLRANIIDVEVDISKGLHSFSIVGLPDKSVEEAKDRISAAIKNSGFPSPQKGNRKVIVSLAPADIKKEGSVYDLAIAVGHLLASGAIKFLPDGKIFVGELALNGEIRPVRGILLLTALAKASGFTEIYLPEENSSEASLVEGIEIYPCKNLAQLISHLDTKKKEEEPRKIEAVKNREELKTFSVKTDLLDLADIRGQETAKRGLLIAATGGHNISVFGPPGVGKTMLAKALTGILPELSFEESLEVTGIHSASGILPHGFVISHPPFRAPHHTSSYVSVVGGGAFPKPGEITLAHRGVLFLDEFPEFEKRVIESMRQPLEDRIINISRQRGSATFPANFLMMTSMNPCPCGYRGSKKKECICMPQDLNRYNRKISGPIMDRIDIWLEVGDVNPEDLSNKEVTGLNSITAREMIRGARETQQKRFSGTKLKTNSEMNVKDIERYCFLTPKLTELLNQSAEKLALSARAYHRVIKLARTIADLEEKEDIEQNHLLEALQYRPKS